MNVLLPWYPTQPVLEHVLTSRRLVWILGPTGAGKSTYATALLAAAVRVGATNKRQVLECGSFARAAAGANASVEELTAHTLACLDNDAFYFAKRIDKETHAMRGRGGGIVVGARNPIDFMTAFSVKDDVAVFLEPRVPVSGIEVYWPWKTSFEHRGLLAIEAYLDFLLASHLIEHDQVHHLVREGALA